MNLCVAAAPPHTSSSRQSPTPAIRRSRVGGIVDWRGDANGRMAFQYFWLIQEVVKRPVTITFRISNPTVAQIPLKGKSLSNF
jgi:hypothetical protein